MKRQEHWRIASPGGWKAGESHASEQAAWRDAEDKTGTRCDCLWHIGYRCVKAEIKESAA